MRTATAHACKIESITGTGLINMNAHSKATEIIVSCRREPLAGFTRVCGPTMGDYFSLFC